MCCTATTKDNWEPDSKKAVIQCGLKQNNLKVAAERNPKDSRDTLNNTERAMHIWRRCTAICRVVPLGTGSPSVAQWSKERVEEEKGMEGMRAS